MKTNLDKDLEEGLKQCKKTYEKFLIALNSLKNKKCIPVFELRKNENGDLEAVNWRLENYE